MSVGIIFGCSSCQCYMCLYWWSSRCPYGECWDDHRSLVNPYDKVHPNEPPRTGWSNWRTDQAYWCRGGFCYPNDTCENYVKIDDSQTHVEDCLSAVVTVYQDGFIRCSLLNSVGCEECMRRFEEKENRKDNGSE